MEVPDTRELTTFNIRLLSIGMAAAPFEIPGPTSPLAVGRDQRYLVVPSFKLESGIEVRNVPIAFKTWGKLDPVTRDNVLLVCHPISGLSLIHI